MSKHWIADNPSAYGFPKQALKRLTEQYATDIAQGSLPGVNLMIARHGKPILKFSAGFSDRESRRPLNFDDLFRIYSMTKPIASVLSLQQIEQGLYELDTPVKDFLPEVSKLLVWDGKQGVAQNTPMTVRHLLTHTSGFSATWYDHDVSRGYINTGSVEYQPHGFTKEPTSLEDYFKRLTLNPLAHQPGAKRTYGVSNDVQGVLISRVANTPLEAHLKNQLLRTLEMENTYFCVPRSKAHRLVTLYRAKRKHIVVDETGEHSAYICPVAMPSLSGGLVSTVEDYWHFAEMLRQRGFYQGDQIINETSADLLGSPQPGIDEGDWIAGAQWGLGVAVVTEPRLAERTEYRDNYYWSGSAGTTFWIDPGHDLVVVMFTQLRDDGADLPHMKNVRDRVYAAMASP